MPGFIIILQNNKKKKKITPKIIFNGIFLKIMFFGISFFKKNLITVNEIVIKNINAVLSFISTSTEIISPAEKSSEE
jgi:hypothetical protein